jgi:hypothetical protein
MVDGKPLPENLASEHEGAAEDSPAPNEALTGESAGAARPTQASPPDETAAPTPPTDLKPGYVVAGAIGMMGFLSSLIWLISFPPMSRGGTAALVGLFLVNVTTQRGKHVCWEFSMKDADRPSRGPGCAEPTPSLRPRLEAEA